MVGHMYRTGKKSFSGDWRFSYRVTALAAASIGSGVPFAAGASFVPFVTDSTHMQAAVLSAALNIPASAGTVRDATGNANDIQIVNFGTVVYTGAYDVTTTLNRIRQNDSVHNNESDDGGFFNFDSGELPNIPRMGANYYMEFMVWPNMDLTAKTYDTTAKIDGSVSFPGPIRLLVGSAGEVYFSGDHYATNDYVNPTAPPAEPTLDTWSASSGNWSAASSWSMSSVPAAAQAAYLTSGDTHVRTVTYDYTGAAATLADLLVNSDGTSSANGSMTLSQSQDTLRTQTEEIWARYATAAVNQSGGSHFVNGALQIGEFVASSGSYTLSGTGTLTAGTESIGDSTLSAGAGTGTFTQSGGTHTVNGVLNIGCNTAGSGSYSLSAGNLTAASLVLNSNGSFTQSGGTLSAGGLVLESGGTFTDGGGSETFTSLELTGSGQMALLSGGDKVVKFGTISAGGTAKLDVADNKLIFTTPNGSFNVIQLIKSGRNGGAWNGSGIVTTMTAATGAHPLTTLAVAVAGDVGKTTFGGLSVSATDTLVMYTYAGDANLDGKINADDYFQIDSHVNKTVDGARSYFDGDFNYDGKINGDDYFIIDSNFASQGTAFSDGVGFEGLSSVPEPMATGLLVGAGLLMVGRRRANMNNRG